jgi:hypothetical protein
MAEVRWGHRAIAWLILAALALPTLFGCGLPRQESVGVDFADIMPEGTEVHYIQRLDADGDEREEWVVFYRYDIPSSEQGNPSRGPIGGAVYKATSTSPPNLLAHPLIPQDFDYLGEEATWATVEDFIKGDQNRQELVVRSGRSREGDEVFSLGIFQWQPRDGDSDGNPACSGAIKARGRYVCLGFFRGSGGVRQDGDRVVVLDRSGFERSQLAIKRVYAPADGSYLTPDLERLRDPVEQSIDFTFGMPESPAQSPYPEKAVLAFYLALGRDNDTARSYLSDESEYKANMDSYEFGTGVPLGDLRGVLVKEIGYTPDEVAEQQHMDRQVSVSVTPVTDAGVMRDEAGGVIRRRVSWIVRWEPLERAEEGQDPIYGWRLYDYKVH